MKSLKEQHASNMNTKLNETVSVHQNQLEALKVK